MSWFQIVIRLPGDAIEAAQDWLLSRACLGVEIRDTDCLSAPEDLPEGWVELRAPWPADAWPEQIQTDLNRFLAGLPIGEDGPAAVSTRVETLAAEDWAHNWRAHFSAVELGRFFVFPGWLEEDRPGLIPVRIDPGLAFGTGMHPTTRLCLLGLDALLADGPPPALLDVGCGSGILAIAAARAGVGRVVAVDNDPVACRVTGENLALNGIENGVEVRGDPLVQIQGRFEVVLANILSGVLLRLRTDLLRHLAPGGHLLLSGILLEEADEVAGAFCAGGAREVGRRAEGDWALLHLEGAS